MKKSIVGLAVGALIGLLLVMRALGGPVISMPGPTDTEASQQGRALWLLPSADPAVPMLTTVFRPAGDGPFPMVLMNHGTTRSPTERLFFPLLEFNAAASWFAERKNVVVAPQRPGHGDTGGPYYEEVVPPGETVPSRLCVRPQFRDAGLAVAADNSIAVAYMTAQPFVDSQNIIVVGQSGGGWGSLAYVSQNPPGVRAMINFAGGRTCRENPRAPELLVQIAGEFCRTTRVPMLWIYTENDKFFPPEVSKPMYEACRAAGAPVEYHLLPSFEDNGHFFVDVPKAIPIWAPIVTKFLSEHGEAAVVRNPDVGNRSGVE
jgi:dienelactone hydrolase